MSDLIDRREAIDALGECPVGDTEWDLGCRNQWEWDTEILRTLPSAEPEQKHGEWLEKEVFDNVDYEIPEWQSEKCSVCGKYHTTPYLYNFRTFEYCPNCGSKMMRGEDGKA